MPTALISVWDKTGLTEFAATLVARGWELVASGGTARALAKAELPVRQVSELTGEPEMLDGRVKTLHPAVHAGVLARDTPSDRAELDARGWRPIDLVAVNLYPFEEIVAQQNVTTEQAVEHIDIGGVTLLRAAAKNFSRVTVLSDPVDYQMALDPPDPAAFRQRMAHKAFVRTTEYDAAIETYFARLQGSPIPLHLTYYSSLDLRYGENPHQQATFYSSRSGGSPMGGELLQGKPLSYNNLLDLDTAWRAAGAYTDPAVVVVKHSSPCGIAIASNAEEAVAPAIASDPVSAFGSVIACNRVVNEAFVEALGDLFIECLVATGFNDGARQRLETRHNLRLLKMPATEPSEHYELRSVVGGLLWQTLDFGDPSDAPPWRVVTHRQPSEREMAEMRFAWGACQSVKSNAVVLARSDSQCRFTVGIGGGQPNRVDCVRIAGERAGERAAEAVLASDAFFPFPDGVEIASTLGVTAIVQPGGSVRDEAVIKTADDMGLTMVFTGVRRFRH
jgi:phosphoribosylaminoimidazolecarboxamide formyltransferase/IMP cyclohydrolase